MCCAVSLQIFVQCQRCCEDFSKATSWKAVREVCLALKQLPSLSFSLELISQTQMFRNQKLWVSYLRVDQPQGFCAQLASCSSCNTHSCYVTDTTEGPLEIQPCHEKKKRQWKWEGWTGFELIAEDWDEEVIMRLQTKTAHERVSPSPGTHPHRGGQEVVRTEWGSNPISWNCCTSLYIQQAAQSS